MKKTDEGMQEAVRLLALFDAGGAEELPNILLPAETVSVVFQQLAQEFPHRKFWYDDGQCGLVDAEWSDGESVVLAWR